MPEEETLISLKKIAKGAGIVFIGMLFSKAMLYLYRLIVARIGVEEYGLLSIGFAILSFAAMVSSLGLPLTAARYIPIYLAQKKVGEAKGLLIFSAKIVAVTSIAIAIVLFFSAEFIALHIFHNSSLVLVLQVFAFAIPFYACGDVFFGALQGLQQMKFFVGIKEMAETLFKAGLTLLLVLLGYGFFGAIVVWASAYLFSFILATYAVRRVFPAFFRAMKQFFARREWLGYSTPLVLAGLFSYVLSWTDTLMIGYFRNVSEVGVYNAALPTAMLLSLVAGPVSTIFLPVTAGLYARRKRTELQRVYSASAKWIFLANLPVLLFFLVFPSQVLNILFGPEYRAGAQALAIISVGYFVYAFLCLSGNLLLAFGKSMQVSLIVAGASSLNLLLNYWLIPAFGLAGAAAATGSSLMACVAIYSLLFYRKTGIQPFNRAFVKGIFAWIASALLAFALVKTVLGPSIFEIALLVIIVVGVYGALLLALRAWDKYDAEMLRAFEKKLGFRLEFLRWFK